MTIFTISMVSFRYFSKSSVPTANKVKNGDYLNKSALELPNSEKVIILFISETCKFCRESGSFYQKLIKSSESKKSISLIAVFPSREKNGENYFEKDGVAFPVKSYVDFTELGVFFTPTILIVDKDSKVLDSWSGKLESDTETKVLSIFNEN